MSSSTTRSSPSSQWQVAAAHISDAWCETSTSDVTIPSLVEISTHCVGLDILRSHSNTNDIISRDYQKITVQHPQRSLRDHYHQGR